MYSCKVVADSLSPQGNRLTSMLVTFPRIILAEFNTHRMFSRNSSSSRAIPFKKMVESVKENPFVPIAWQKDHKGMQGVEYHTDIDEILSATENWIDAIRSAVFSADRLSRKNGVTKQLCNRLLEPFMWQTVLVSATEWENFFKLRCPQYDSWNYNDYGGQEKTTYRSKKDWIKSCGHPKNTFLVPENGHPEFNCLEGTELDWLNVNSSQADIHIQAIAELMWDARNESNPKQLQPGEWHIPFGDNIDEEDFMYYLGGKGQTTEVLIDNLVSSGAFREDELTSEFLMGDYTYSHKYGAWLTKSMIDYLPQDLLNFKLKVATTRCARTSYTVLGDNTAPDYTKDIALFTKLANSQHWSPFEHCAEAMGDETYNSQIRGYAPLEDESYSLEKADVLGWCRNFRGFIQYRDLIDG